MVNDLKIYFEKPCQCVCACVYVCACACKCMRVYVRVTKGGLKACVYLYVYACVRVFVLSHART